MNERLKELAEQAGLDAKEIRENGSQTLYAFENFDLERFADLVRQNYLRELRALKPVGEFMIAADINGKNCYIHVEDKDTFTFTLYALDEVTK